MLFAESLPVGLIPEKLLSLCYFVPLAAVDSFLKPMGLDMVNYCGWHRSALVSITVKRTIHF